MRRLNLRVFGRVFNPNYYLSPGARAINKRWLYRQSFVLSLGSSFLTVVSFPLFHLLTYQPGETPFAGYPHRIAVVVTAVLCLVIPILWKRLRQYTEYFSFLNLVVLFACIAIDVALSERQRRYTAIGLVPLFGSTFVFTEVRVMTVAYSLSAAFFVTINSIKNRSGEILAIYAIAYFIAWWMAMIRIRSLQRISFDQAKVYDRKVYDQRIALARDLHDSLGGDLMQLSLQLSGNTPREKMLDLAYEVIAKTKNLVYTLEPGNENENFAAYVCSYCRRLTQTGKFEMDVQIAPDWPALRMDQSLNLQAIFTEWMTNTIRHSGATWIRVKLRCTTTGYFLIVRDNGMGFRWNGRRQGSGLRNISLRTDLLHARCFARRMSKTGGTLFFLRGDLAHD